MKKEAIKRFREAEKKIFENNGYEGESIEEKVARITENNEPITDGVSIIYTKRKDGVQPQYDIRTDIWDLAQEKMSIVAESKKNKIKENMSKGLATPKEETPKVETPKSAENQN